MNIKKRGGRIGERTAKTYLIGSRKVNDQEKSGAFVVQLKGLS
jgi:hypothetical protein